MPTDPIVMCLCAVAACLYTCKPAPQGCTTLRLLSYLDLCCCFFVVLLLVCLVLCLFCCLGCYVCVGCYVILLCLLSYLDVYLVLFVLC